MKWVLMAIGIIVIAVLGNLYFQDKNSSAEIGTLVIEPLPTNYEVYFNTAAPHNEFRTIGVINIGENADKEYLLYPVFSKNVIEKVAILLSRWDPKRLFVVAHSFQKSASSKFYFIGLVELQQEEQDFRVESLNSNYIVFSNSKAERVAKKIQKEAGGENTTIPYESLSESDKASQLLCITKSII